MKSLNPNRKIINELLVTLFNDILEIEEKALKQGELNDLSVTEIHTIEAIGMYKPRTMTEVANDLGITVGTLTTAITKLVKKEYVERTRGEEDRRSVMIALTRRGKIAYRIHEKFHQEMINETIGGLSHEEEEILVRSLDKINKFFKDKYDLKNR